MLIGIGLLAAGFSSAITAPLSAAYAVNGVLGWGKTLKDLKFKAVWIIVLVAGCLMACAAGQEPHGADPGGSGGQRYPAAYHGVLRDVRRQRQELGKWRNHAFSNICGVIFICITLFMCWRNMSSFLASLQTLVGA